MNRILKLAAFSVLSSLSFAVMGASAQAVDYAGEAHCFTRSAGTGDSMLYPEDQYANGTLQDEERVKAVEDLTKRHWGLRLTGMPFAQNRAIFNEQFDAGINGKQQRFNDFDVDASIWLDQAQERRNRRTGSRYMYVTPQLKKLARDRSEIRALKEKPCNKHILYLGG